MMRCRSSRWNNWSPNGRTGGSAAATIDGTAIDGAAEGAGVHKGSDTMSPAPVWCRCKDHNSGVEPDRPGQGPVRYRRTQAARVMAGGFRLGLVVLVRVRFGGFAGTAWRGQVGLDVDRVAGGISHLDALRDQVDGLAPQQFAGGGGELVVLGELPVQAFRRDADLLRLPIDVVGELGLIHAELFLAGQLVQHQGDLDRAPRPALQVELKLLLGLAGHLQRSE